MSDANIPARPHKRCFLAHDCDCHVTLTSDDLVTTLKMADSQSVAHAIRAAARSIGYTDLRVLQESAVKSFVAGNDVFVAIPTGGGKSLCYSLLPAVFDRIRGNVTPQCLAIVVSPLVALIQDQVRGLTGRGVSAVHLKSSEDDDFSDMCNGMYHVLFISPETLLRDPGVRDMLLSSVFQDNLVVLAIDEAHCIKKWLVCYLLCA